jgi:hypothetical protein
LDKQEKDHEIALTGTIWFVLVMLAAFVVGWFSLYELMGSRW